MNPIILYRDREELDVNVTKDEVNNNDNINKR